MFLLGGTLSAIACSDILTDMLGYLDFERMYYSLKAQMFVLGVVQVSVTLRFKVPKSTILQPRRNFVRVESSRGEEKIV